MTPLVSVVMSVYNGAEYLSDAIESILSQTMEDLEFIIIDDGSSDGSLESIKGYKSQDARIVLISRENRGLIDSLNEGIEKASGKYIARMDADDISMPGRLQKQVDFMEKNPNIGLCGTWIEAFDEYGTKVTGRYSVDDPMLRCELLFSSPFAHPSVMMRSDLLRDNGLSYNKEYVDAEDYELWYQCAKVTELGNIPQVLLRYRLLVESVTRKADRDDASREKVLREVYRQLLDDLGLQFSDDEMDLHYTLTLNTRIAKNHYDPKILTSHFDRLITANEKREVFDKRSLLQLLGKKWLWHLRYHFKSHPQLILNSLFSKYSYYGLLALYQSRKGAAL